MTINKKFKKSSRGLSTVAGYTLTLAITGILVFSLISGVIGFVDSQSDRTSSYQLHSAGNTLSSEIITVHSIATDPSHDEQEITTEVKLPERTISSSYTIEITDNQIKLKTTGNNIVEVTKSLPSTSNDITITSDGRISGGEVKIEYNGGDEIKVKSL